LPLLSALMLKFADGVAADHVDLGHDGAAARDE
jgi:hypothetical protein